MFWLLFLMASLACLVASTSIVILNNTSKGKKKFDVETVFVLGTGVALSSFFIFIPISAQTLRGNLFTLVDVLLVALHNTMKLFAIDSDFSVIVDNTYHLNILIKYAYWGISALLFVLAPVITSVFVLSFFKNAFAYCKYAFATGNKLYIFTELNERSLALAESLSNSNESKVIVFTFAYNSADENNEKFLIKAKDLGAICFKKDIVSINLNFKNRETSIFVLGEDEAANVNLAMNISEKYNTANNIKLYVLSSAAAAEVLLGSFMKNSTVKIKRVSEVRSLIDRTLYDKGTNIFDSAIEKDGVKQINALVIGMGQHGTDMTKALSWYCQMDGYRLEINCFDESKYADQIFASLCPELMDDDHNGKFDVDGEAKYKITVHPEVNVLTKKFDDMITSIPDVTYIFVALGDDEMNITTAMKLRSLFKQKGLTPYIQAIVYNSDKMGMLKDIENFKGEKYDIDFIGDMKTTYSKEVIISSDLEKKAFDRHKGYCSYEPDPIKRQQDENMFWLYEYSYRSTIASIIHKKARSHCKITGSDKLLKDRSEEENNVLRKLEHCRWNAYVRSEGYRYSGSIEKATRNDLAKLHNFLVPFDELPPSEKVKDDYE